MTYRNFINNIINTRGKWGLAEDSYFEMHHILPLCLGGCGDHSDGTFRKKSEHWNCIWLTPQEHFLAHKLLAEEYSTNYNLIYAYHMMANCTAAKTNKRDYEITEEDYKECKILYSNMMSEKLKIDNPAKRDDVKLKISISKEGNKNPMKRPDVIAKMLKTRRENNAHWEKTPEQIENAARAHYVKVKCIETGEVFESMKAVKAKYGKSLHISDACSGKREKAGGYHWEYVE